MCLDKTVYCSITITNLDSEKAGTFGLEFNFFIEDSQEIIFSSFFEEFIEPEENYIFEETFNVGSEYANVPIGCIYYVIESPEKEVC